MRPAIIRSYSYPIAGVAQPTVLVADDDPSLRLLCRVNLELDGYRVLEAASSAELWNALAAEDVRAILLDVHLGDDDGFEIARALRADRPDVAFAFFSGSFEGLEETADRLSGAVLPKPFTLEQLSEVARRLVRG